ncbi:MAG TPA: hypothetical protein VH208_12480, partial [Myxococcaceae bacterium]|nr:hypothetical protein [Myxococcaceae bacterium]
LATPAFVAEHNVFLWDMNVSTPATTPLTLGPWDCFGSAANCVTQFDFQSNVYWNPTAGVQPEFLVVPDAGVNGMVVPLSAWQSTYGEDPGSVFADPQFTHPGCPQDDYSFASTGTVTGVGFVPFDGKDAGRDAPVLTAPSVAPAFPLQVPADPCTYD